ncbi:MAG TPA: cytochrome c oxidase subunit II [Acidimicrobiales bacterium]
MRLPPGPRRLWPVVAVVATAAACDVPNFGAPDAKSEEGASILRLWQGFFITALFVAALVWGLLIFVLVRYRRRRGDGDELPSQRPYNIPLEVFYTAAPVVVVAVLFGFSVATQEEVTGLHDDPEAVAVDVIGFQWSWQFRYRDEGVTVTGEPGEPPELVLPVGRRAHLELTTADVNHSFWVPDFLSKRDLIPGIDNEIEVTPTETGEYVGRCAEFCGLDHWRMYYAVRVVPEDEYETWLDEHRGEGADLPVDELDEGDEGDGTGGGGVGVPSS